MHCGFDPRDVLLTLSNRLKEGNQKLMKKRWGQLIYISDFIKEENGHLIIYNKEGDIMKDVQHIIYSRVGGNKW